MLTKRKLVSASCLAAMSIGLFHAANALLAAGHDETTSHELCSWDSFYAYFKIADEISPIVASNVSNLVSEQDRKAVQLEISNMQFDGPNTRFISVHRPTLELYVSSCEGRTCDVHIFFSPNKIA